MEWSAMGPIETIQRRVGLIAAVLAIVAGLWTADVLLARVENRETQVQARHYFDQGATLLASGHPAQAMDPLRKAHAMDRFDLRYSLRLAEALMGAGKLDEAHSMLAEILQRTPNDGQASLLEARIAAGRGDLNEAEASYHRAIYGTWNGAREDQIMRVRLELANLLTQNGRSQELLAELLPLETAAQNDIAVREQVAKLYMAAGSPARSVAAYRALLRERDEPSNYQGLGEAQLALGNYRDAEAAFQQAGDDERAQRAAEMAELDPTLRRLSSAEKFARSVTILTMARNALASCSADARSNEMLESANKELAAKARGAITNEMAEERLTMAEELWKQRKASCGPANTTDDALSRLMLKLGAS
jgi:tetratricopeptide (TPR) repeat protein